MIVAIARAPCDESARGAYLRYIHTDSLVIGAILGLVEAEIIRNEWNNR